MMARLYEHLYPTGGIGTAVAAETSRVSAADSKSAEPGDGMARLYEHLYTYGAIELERMVWNGQDRGASCEGDVQDSACIVTIELREYVRTQSTSPELGDGHVVYTATRDSPERVALVPREDLAR
jgi:hypothetical protein